MWLPGVGATNSPSGSISKSRMSGVRSRTERRAPFRHSTCLLMANLLGRLAWNMSRMPALCFEHRVDQLARPKRSGIDVEVVERQARILVDGHLLGFEHHVVLIVNALALVDMGLVDVLRELLVVRAEGSHEVPEVVAAPVSL